MDSVNSNSSSIQAKLGRVLVNVHSRAMLDLLSAIIPLPNTGQGSAPWAARPEDLVQCLLLSPNPSCSDKRAY